MSRRDDRASGDRASGGRTSSGKILIVDDDEDVWVAGQLLLRRHVDEVVTANRPERIAERLAEQSFDVVLLDMNFAIGETSGEEGFAWLERILAADPDAVVVLMTAYSRVDLAVEAMKRGATDFVSKPWQNEKLVATVSAAVRLRQTRERAADLARRNRELAAHTAGTGRGILGQSRAIRSVLSVIDRAAPTEANVLILGENGTGKELVARDIHRRSQREGEVFLSVDVGAISENLFESELFGHKKGSFTGAGDDRIGRLQAASGGTVFLDEIGNLPRRLQAKLLTALEQRQVTPVGSNKPVAIDVRIISATNLAPSRLRDEQVFRQDLLYRLNTVEILLPPLRERGEDIPILASHFAAQYAHKYGRSAKSISDAAMAALGEHAWPGNIRALRHAVERAVIMAEGDQLEPEDFALTPPATPPLIPPAPAPASPLSAPPGLAAQPSADSTGDSGELGDLNLARMERRLIEQALRKHHWNISHAARELGLTRTSLYRRMEKYRL